MLFAMDIVLVDESRDGVNVKLKEMAGGFRIQRF